ncbi:MAG: hypothetical protein GY906_16260, partial [bacterium]|nr:hypothetical protein [bacterium]
QERALQLAYTARAELSDAGERGLEDLRLVDEWLTERTTQAEESEADAADEDDPVESEGMNSSRTSAYSC